MMATLASYQGLFGPYNPQTLAMTIVLAVALYDSGHPLDGRRLLERALGDLTRHHGRHHPVRIRALEAWSTLLSQEAEWKAALPVQRELLEMPHAHPWPGSSRFIGGAEQSFSDAFGYNLRVIVYFCLASFFRATAFMQ
jgi:hypothetical protein